MQLSILSVVYATLAATPGGSYWWVHPIAAPCDCSPDLEVLGLLRGQLARCGPAQLTAPACHCPVCEQKGEIIRAVELIVALGIGAVLGHLVTRVQAARDLSTGRSGDGGSGIEPISTPLQLTYVPPRWVPPVGSGARRILR